MIIKNIISIRTANARIGFRMKPGTILNQNQISFEELLLLLKNPSDQFNWILSFDTHLEKIFYSDNFFPITGYYPAELENPHFKNNLIITQEYYSAVKNEFNKFFNSYSSDDFIIQYKIQTKDKRNIWLSETVKAERDDDGKIIRCYGSTRDVTEYVEELDKLGSYINELRATIHSKDGFISILSHDLRAPFTSILGFSEILLNETHLSEHDKTEYLSYINQSSQNQLQLINYMLEWSRLQMGKVKPDIQRLQLQTIVFNCVSFLTGNAVRKNIDIKVNIDNSLYVEADERLLIQAVLGLLSNAVKFSNENQTVEVSAGIYDENFIELFVRDDGVGISDLNKNKLFKIDKLFSTEGTKGEKGTGLGLTLVKEIVEKHGGQIWYFSEQNKGSEFHITITRSKETILIVNDDLTLLNEMKDIVLANYPSYSVLSADNGYLALDLIKKRIPCLIIINHDLPLMNGLQLLVAIKKNEKNFAIPVITFVNSISEELRAQYNATGVNSILEGLKNHNELVNQINKILAN